MATQSKLNPGLGSSSPAAESFAVRDLRKGFLWAPRELIFQAAPVLGPLPIAVYMALASYANASQVAFPSLSTLSRLLGVSRYAVRRALERLERFNIIRKEQIPGPGRRRVRYVLLDPAVWRLPESADAKPEAQSCTTEEAASETEKVLVASAALAQSGAQPGAIVPEPQGSPPENGQRKGISDLAQLCPAGSNGKIADENSNRKRGDSELNGAAQLCQRAKPEGNGNRVPASAGNRHITISYEQKERTNGAGGASLEGLGAPAARHEGSETRESVTLSSSGWRIAPAAFRSPRARDRIIGELRRDLSSFGPLDEVLLFETASEIAELFPTVPVSQIIRQGLANGWALRELYAFASAVGFLSEILMEQLLPSEDDDLTPWLLAAFGDREAAWKLIDEATEGHFEAFLNFRSPDEGALNYGTLLKEALEAAPEEFPWPAWWARLEEALGNLRRRLRAEGVDPRDVEIRYFGREVWDGVLSHLRRARRRCDAGE